MARYTYEQAAYGLFRHCNSYEILPTLMHERRHMLAADWWRALGHAWSSCDNIAAWKDDLRALLLRARRRNVEQMMTNEERAALLIQPEALTIYRGCYDINRDGLSWTLSRETAEAFPTLHRYRRAGDRPLLLTGCVRRNAVILKLGRGEDEIVAPRVEILDETSIELSKRA